MSDGWVESVWRSRKDTRTWCKGKVGTPHQLVVEIDRRSGMSRCYWTSTYATLSGERRHQWSYHCRHIERCTECLKIMRFFLDRTECPDKQPEPGDDVQCHRCGLTLAQHNGYVEGHSFWFNGRDGDKG